MRIEATFVPGRVRYCSTPWFCSSTGSIILDKKKLEKDENEMPCKTSPLNHLSIKSSSHTCI